MEDDEFGFLGLEASVIDLSRKPAKLEKCEDAWVRGDIDLEFSIIKLTGTPLILFFSWMPNLVDTTYSKSNKAQLKSYYGQKKKKTNTSKIVCDE